LNHIGHGVEAHGALPELQQPVALSRVQLRTRGTQHILIDATKLALRFDAAFGQQPFGCIDLDVGLRVFIKRLEGFQVLWCYQFIALTLESVGPAFAVA